MLERACRTAAAWTDLPVSINVSPLQFARADLAGEILSIAEAANLSTTRLEIEITETAPFADIDAARRVIETLRARGVVVALDDLGSGHATTCLMRQLPLDRVKLGKDIVDLAATQEGGAGVAELIGLARDLGLGVTAEGVETQEQLARLRAWGCDRIQGYLFARPMMGDEIDGFVRLIAK
jgi:EAL domain-containing protein (putative c-di-GMP-specific phosphodiesterase class I)